MLHIALVGFMGAGKSTVGRALAERVGMSFVDLDTVIAEDAQLSIPDIFREHGEVGFRARERAALRKVLSAQEPSVIATGGGTFIDPAMRDAIVRQARTVYLEASAETLLHRVLERDEPQQRPMLQGPDPAATLRRLLNERITTYQQCEVVVAADQPLEKILNDVVRSLRLDPVNGPDERRLDGRRSARPTTARPVLEIESSHGAYPVELRGSAGTWIANAITQRVVGRRIAVLSDTTVAPLHADRLVADLRAKGKEPFLITVPPGEDSKSLEWAGRVIDAMLAREVTRQDAAVALGGGVVGDLCGFVASTILRGIDFFQVPTTTLAAVDSSVGGKTAVNTPRGKNLVGTFYPPRGVYIAAEHLATQGTRQHAAGLAEALKMAATLDRDLFDDITQRADKLLAFDAEALLTIISRALQLKAAVVARDEKETGERAVLNYGHTLGHAIESGELYRLLHGEAVALGMVAEAEWAVGEGMPARITDALREGLASLGLPTDWTSKRSDLSALGLDKKRVGASVRVPLIPEIGTYELRSVPVTALTEFVKRRSSC